MSMGSASRLVWRWELDWGCVPTSVLVMARVSLLGQVWVLPSRGF
jgi:hypothetical protein